MTSTPDLEPSDERYRVLILTGSPRQPSHTVALGRAIEAEFANYDAEVFFWDDLSLPSADPEFHKTQLQHEVPEVRAFAELAQSCDAFVWISPIYHNSYSSHLKNMLDHLNIPQFRDKVVGLASHGSNRSPQAVDHLRIVARSLNAITTPSHVCTANEDFDETEDGYVVSLDNENIRGRIARLVSEVDWMTRGLSLYRRRGGDGLVAEHAAPAGEWQVRGEDEGGVFVAG